MARRARASDESVRNLVVISDTHCGCRLGLCQPGGVRLDDGGTYHLGQTQEFIWHHWRKFWDSWVPHVCKGEPFAVIHNGDALDGVPHRATTPISTNLDDQHEIGYRCLAEVVERCEGRYYHVRGTEAHVGKSSVEEERLAKRLAAVPNGVGQYARYELWKRLGLGKIHFAHHIGVTSSTHYETSAVNAELTKLMVESSRWELPAADLVCRSHRHQYCEVVLAAHREGWGDDIASRQRIRCVVTPAWQGKTPFAYRVARGKPPQFGGVLIRWNGEVLYTESYVVTLRDVQPE